MCLRAQFPKRSNKDLSIRKFRSSLGELPNGDNPKIRRLASAVPLRVPDPVGYILPSEGRRREHETTMNYLTNLGRGAICLLCLFAWLCISAPPPPENQSD